MLDALVRNSGLDRVLDATISVDAKKIFKPAPEAYSLIEIRSRRAARGSAVHLVESVGRLRRQGLRAQRRLDRAGDAGSDGAGLRQSDVVAPLTLFKAIRTQMDELGVRARLSHSRAVELPGLVAAHKVEHEP